jgi:hypothetical protein
VTSTPTVWAYLLDGDEPPDTGGFFIPGAGLVISLSADLEGLRWRLGLEAQQTAEKTGRRLRLVQLREDEVIDEVDPGCPGPPVTLDS